MSTDATSPNFTNVHCDNCAGLASEGFNVLEKACVAFSDLSYQDGWNEKLADQVDRHMAHARECFSCIVDTLPLLEKESRELDAAMAKIAELEAELAGLEGARESRGEAA